MRALSAAEIVRVWERGAGQHPLDRALTILGAADQDIGRATLSDLPLGERNRRLLGVRERTFGPDLSALAACERCGERVEIRLPAADAIEGAVPASSPDTPIAVRRLTSRDLAAAAQCPDAESARRVLAARAIDGTAAKDEPEPVMSDAAIDAIAERLHELDPLAVLTLDVQCPGCGTPWECELDAGEYVWIEIEAEALRMLRDVHTLAAAYGWHEADILAMSPIRRRVYLELVQ